PRRVVLVGELAAAGMKDAAAALGRERMQQKPAGIGIARVHQLGDHLEILTRLPFGPRALAGRELLQAEIVVALRMAHVAARVAGALLQKDRLDLALEGVVIECRRGRELAAQPRSQRECNDQPSATRHAQPPCFARLYQTSRWRATWVC